MLYVAGHNFLNYVGGGLQNASIWRSHLTSWHVITLWILKLCMLSLINEPFHKNDIRIPDDLVITHRPSSCPSVSAMSLTDSIGFNLQARFVNRSFNPRREHKGFCIHLQYIIGQKTWCGFVWDSRWTDWSVSPVHRRSGRYRPPNRVEIRNSSLSVPNVCFPRVVEQRPRSSNFEFRAHQEIIYSRIKIQYYRIALACKKDRRRWGKSVAEKIFCSVMSCSADLIL